MALIAAALPFVAYVAVSMAFPFPEPLLEEPAGAVRVVDREGESLRSFIGDGDCWSFPIALSDASPRLVEATIAVEDKRFRSHHGVDLLALSRAVSQNVRHWRRVSGASTITMQAVRLVEPRPRTLASKAVEALRATQLERLRGKDAILALYLNRAPYGGNLIGVEAASLAYFRKHARDLSLAEAALLAGLPQAPSRLRPDRHPERAKARRDYVLERMHACGFITKGDLARAQDQPVCVERRPFPFDAPHLARLVRHRYRGEPLLHATLDRRIQRLAEAAIREGVDALRPGGVTNGAVVVIENHTGAVRALVGSCDFHADEDAGQVNGATASRSPGSALKPFTYALAFARGLATPDTVLADVPFTCAGYRPENYDHDWRGPVTVRAALRASLNVPAVRLLGQVGHRQLHAFLRELGLSTLTRDADHYGLALTLGSTDVTLLELTNAYAALARLGVYRPYRLLETGPVAPGRRVLSEGAAYLVADVLAGPHGDRIPRHGGTARGGLRIAWKTGTSYGHRDAWTVAYTPRFTVGVWVGNFSGEPSRELVGIRAATPVAATLMARIYGESAARWYARPASVVTRSICPVSGMPPGPHCPAAAEGLCLEDASDGATCAVHAEVLVDAETGSSLCSHCSQGHTFTSRVAEAWPADLAAWLREQGHGQRLVPPHLESCRRGRRDGGAPRIVSPSSGERYVLLDAAAHQKLLLKAASRSSKLYWFVDGALHTAADADTSTFWPLRSGPHTILCTDDAGQSDRVTIEVK